METQYLRTLIAVIQTGSFSKAADQLGITQSAVSQRIKFMEDRYGYKLIDRNGPVLVPSNAGNTVLQKAERILILEREMEDELKKLGRKSRLSLCCTPTFGTVYLPTVLNTFILRNADIVDFKFMMTTPDQALRGMQDFTYDVGVIEHLEDLELSSFRTYQLPDDELVFVSAPGLGLPVPEAPLETLLECTLIARKEGCSSRQLLTLNLARQGRSLDDFKNVVIYDDLRLTIQAIQQQTGIAFASTRLVQPLLDAGALVAHTVPGFSHRRLRTIAVNKKRYLDQTLRSFLESIFSAFGMKCPHLE